MRKLAILTACGVACGGSYAAAEECHPGLALAPIVQAQLSGTQNVVVGQATAAKSPRGADTSAIRRALNGGSLANLAPGAVNGLAVSSNPPVPVAPLSGATAGPSPAGGASPCGV